MRASRACIWTARFYPSAYYEATRRGREDLIALLLEHHYHGDHCGGYDVAAWPCPTAARVLNELLGGAA